MFAEIIVDQNRHWHSNAISISNLPRDKFTQLKAMLDIPHVIAVTGIRRCGKSTLLQQTIQYLLEHKKIAAENIFFLNLEQPYLLQFSQDINNLEKIFQEYLALKNPQGKIYVLLDEIQFFSNWPVFIKSHYETKNVKFIITGSNSSLLSSEMVTLLSGRAMPLELYPFSFKEIANTIISDYNDTSKIISARNTLKPLLANLLETGAFPEIHVLPDKKLYPEILSNYAKTIVLQDIAPRLQVRKPKQLEELFSYLATNISAATSYSKLANHFSLSDKSIKEYIQAFSAAYLLFELKSFSYSMNPKGKIAKKIYLIDNGMANACGFRFSKNNGKLLENLIFIDCKQRDLDIFFYKTKNNLEIDFIIKKDNVSTPIQVAWEITSVETFQREIRALSTALDRKSVV